MRLRDLLDRFSRVQDRSPTIAAFLVLGLLCGAVLAIVGVGTLVWRGIDWVRPDSQTVASEDYEWLASLRFGQQVEAVESRMGPARSTEQAGGLLFQAFPGDRYLLATASDPAGRIQALAVSTCSRDFHPELQAPSGSLVLNEMTMADIQIPPTLLNYSVGGSGGFSYWILDAYSGHSEAGGFTDYYVGQFYRCLDDSAGPDQVAAIDVIASSSDASVVEGVEQVEGVDGFYSGPPTDSAATYREEWPITAYLRLSEEYRRVGTGFILFTESSLWDASSQQRTSGGN